MSASTHCHVQEDNDLSISATRLSIFTLRNRKAPINKIPPEILIKILSTCATIDPVAWVEHSPEPCAPVHFNPGWLNLTYVCSFWRSAALHCPGLWAPHATNEFGLLWMEVILPRSMEMAVSLRFDLNRVTPADVELLAKHMSRISNITLAGSGATMKTLFNVLTSPAPMLNAVRMETGTLPCIEYLDRLWGRRDISTPVLSEDVFSLQAPRLRHLHLVNYLPPLTLPVSGTLLGVEHLKVTTWTWRGRDNASSDAASTAKLGAVLQHMKELRTLELRHCLPPWSAEKGSTDSSIIDLPHLRFLAIEDDVPECGTFARRLRIPATAQLFIQCKFEGGGLEEEWAKLTSFLRTQMGAGSQPIQALWLVLPNFHTSAKCITFKVVAWRSLVALPADTPPPGFAISFTLEIPIDDRVLVPSSATVMRALRVLPLAGVQIAQYTLLRGKMSDERLTRAAMRCSPNVESLWVTGPGSAVVADALWPKRTTHNSGPPTYTLYLPFLRMIGFAKVNLGANREPQFKHNYRRLRRCLKARKDVKGHSLKLGIRHCAMRREWLELLREVADVEWDGMRRDVHEFLSFVDAEFATTAKQYCFL